MKKALFVTMAVILMAASTGCNRGWPSCFCRNHQEEYTVSDACGCDGAAETCEGTGAYYGSTAPAVEYVRPAAPVPTPETMPGPAANTTRGG